MVYTFDTLKLSSTNKKVITISTVNNGPYYNIVFLRSIDLDKLQRNMSATINY